jgi:PAS domain-containing protein
MEEGRPITTEVLLYRLDGSPFWSQVSVTPIRDAASGAVVAHVVVQRDVSQRKAAEAALRLREAALSNLAEGITICDPGQADCPVIYCNDAFLRWVAGPFWRGRLRMCECECGCGRADGAC